MCQLRRNRLTVRPGQVTNTRPADPQRIAASRAFKNNVSASEQGLSVEDRFLALLKAVCAKPMPGLAVLHAWLRRVGERADNNFLKLVALLLSFPVFEAHNLLFKAVYAINVRRMRLASVRKRLLGVEDVALQPYLDLIDLGFPGNSVEALRQLQCRLEACKPRTDFSDHHPPSPRATYHGGA